MEDVKYLENGDISAVIDGQALVIPDSMSNRHRKMLAEWEALGNFIAPYVEPPLRERLPPLPRAKFRAALKAGGYLAAIASALAAISDAKQKALAQEMLDATSTFRRNDLLVERVRQAIGLTPEQFDTFWSDAAGLELTI